MKYLRHILGEAGCRINDFLRRMCGALSEDARVIVIALMLLVFTVGNLYFTISAIRNWGRGEERKAMPRIQHIGNLDKINSGSGHDTIHPMEASVEVYRQDSDSINSNFNNQ